MVFKEIVESLGVQAEQIAIVTLATDGYRPEKANMLMFAIRRWNPAIGEEDQEITQQMLIEGGDCSETQKITGITPDIYMQEARPKTEVEQMFLDLTETWGTTCLAGHGALKFMMPFMLKLSHRAAEMQCLDTQLLSKIYHHRRWTLNDKMKTVNQFMTENNRLSFPREPSTSLDAMLEHFDIPPSDDACPYQPIAKSVETAELLKRLWVTPV